MNPMYGCILPQLFPQSRIQGSGTDGQSGCGARGRESSQSVHVHGVPGARSELPHCHQSRMMFSSELRGEKVKVLVRREMGCKDI